MANAGSLLDEARSHLGYVEGKGNNTPFGEWSGFQNQAWCCSFTSYCLSKVGLSMGHIAYCPTAVAWYRNRNQLFSKPMPGDQMLIYFSGRYAHTGFVEVVDGNYVTTIEGNTDVAGGFSGGKVMRKRRLWKGTKNVFGRPAYTSEPAYTPKPAPTVSTPLEETPMAQVITRPQGGYVVLQGKDGGIFSYEGAPFFGSLPSLGVHEEAVGLAWTKTGNGYWIASKSGAVFSCGDAAYKGGLNTIDADGNRIPVGIVADGDGYRVVTQDPSGDASPYDHYGFA